jgi:hypothetical protein
MSLITNVFRAIPIRRFSKSTKDIVNYYNSDAPNYIINDIINDKSQTLYTNKANGSDCDTKNYYPHGNPENANKVLIEQYNALNNAFNSAINNDISEKSNLLPEKLFNNSDNNLLDEINQLIKQSESSLGESKKQRAEIEKIVSDMNKDCAEISAEIEKIVKIVSDINKHIEELKKSKRTDTVLIYISLLCLSAVSLRILSF